MAMLNPRLTKKPAYPSELKRILESPHIVKAGAGVVNDVQALWRDLLSDMQNVYDVGFMARLAMAERFPGLAYTNVGLEACAAEYLGWTLDKTFASSPWRPENGELSPAQIQCTSNALPQSVC